MLCLVQGGDGVAVRTILDSNRLERVYYVARVESENFLSPNESDTNEAIARVRKFVISLSLIHISEPTRPY